METTIKTPKSKVKTLMVLLIVIPVIITFTCLVLNISPLKLEWIILDFAAHHYYIFGFICFVMILLFIKFYYSDSIHPNKNRNLSYLFRKAYYRNRRRNRNYYKKNFTKKQDSEIVVVDKKYVNNLNFSQDDVLLSVDEKKLRENELKKSMSLGNQYKQKVKIFFRDENQNLLVETTVWSADQNYICLKGGAVIPVRSIYKVIL